MLHRVKKAATKEEVLDLLQPLIRDWFTAKFAGLTEPQAYAVPLIHARKNVLVSSPTGSGKTLTAFLSIINELYATQLRGELKDQIYCLYVSPLKALANDINRNLEEPLRELTELATKEGKPTPGIRVAVRSGDTSAQERQKQVRRPPHIFITTPESLAIILSTPKFREAFSRVQWVIIDEIHELCSSKRGALLSVGLERLREQTGADFVRIGLSATIAPIEEEAKFLAGYTRGKVRDMHIVEVDTRKSLDLSVLCPVKDMTAVPMDVANARMYDLLSELIDAHRTTLIFTNTRSGTEHVSFKLKERGVEDLEAHHGSLSKVTRLDVEEKLKRGELKAAVSSTSLELGIDIGYIDLVVQIGSPKSVAKGLQRIGRAGHAYGETAKGRMIVFEPWDLMECATLAKAAYDGRIDRVDIPTNPLDVLAQGLVAMSLEKRWDVDEAFELIRRSYSFHDLPKKDFLAVLDYLSSRNPDIKVFAKVWFDEQERRFGKKKGTRMIYYTNVGTIPEEGTYHVYSERGTPLGELSEKFVEYLSPGDIFVLGGRTHQFVRARGTSVYVKDASGRRPTVPSWTGEMLPRSFDLSIAVGEFRRNLAAKIDADGEAAAREWLIQEYRVDAGSAQSLVSYIQEQRALIDTLPTDRRVLLEGYIDVKGNRNVIFHFPFGRRVNDALSRAYAFALTEAYHTNVRVSVTDDNFMLTVPKRIELDGLVARVTSDNLEELLRRAIKNTELFKQRFRHCATRSFMVLRNYMGREVSIGRQQLRSQRVLDWLHEIEDFPVVKETYNEILHAVMDLDHARDVLRAIESGTIGVTTNDFSGLPSPFAHNVVLQGVSDLVLMEDRSALLRELHRKVLERVLPTAAISSIQFQPEEIRDYFRKKLPKVARKEDLLTYLERVGDANLLREKGRSVFEVATASRDDVRKWAGQLMDEGLVESVWTPQGIHWAARERVPLYAAVNAQRARLKPPEEKVLSLLRERPRSHKDLLRATKMEKGDLNEVLRKLERAYLVGRRGVEETTYFARDVAKAGFDDSLDKLLARRLEADGPQTAQELAVALGLEAELVEETLRDLESEGLVSSGHFLVDRDFQYMMTRDLQHLQRKGETREVFEEGQVKAFLLEKQFTSVRTIDDYFDRFLEVGMVLDLWNHASEFDYAEWLKRRKSGDILEGRFLNGRVRYVRAKDVPFFLSAFPRSPLTELEAKVLEAIRSGDGMDLYRLVAKLKVDKERVKEALDKLDYDVYVIRRFQGDGWTARNLYVAFDPPEAKVPNAMETLVRHFLAACGPVPFSGIREWARFEWDELEILLDRLEEEGVVTRILVTGKTETEMYVLSEALPHLRKAVPAGVRDPVRVLSLLDPWAQPLWAQTASRYGEGWFFPLVKDGDLAGMAEIWEMSGCIEVRELDLVAPELLPEAVAALVRTMTYYGSRGVDVLRVTRFLGKDVPEADDLSPFTKAGFVRLGDFLAHGPILPRDFEKGTLLAYVLHRQGIAPESRFPDMAGAAKALAGLRSDLAARLRVADFRPLERLHRQGLLETAKGIPEYATYLVPEDLPLFKAAKSTSLGKEAKYVLKLIAQEGPISRQRLLALSDLAHGATMAAVRKLLDGLQITVTADRRYRVVPDLKISRDDARREVLRRLVRSVGVTSAEALASFTRFEFNMGETRQRLREFEEEGWLAKGFLAHGERTLYWILREDLDRIESLAFKRKFVLTPMDNLFLFLRQDIVAKYHSGYCYVVFDGLEMAASFKAKRRKTEFIVTEFEGDPSARRIVDAWEEDNELAVEEEVDRISDHEVMEWFAKMYGRGAAER
ncbi:MAG TPA: ATP-dependent helicase [Thermoplasmata archaeon]|nr:ATP-dependent helicase [Thermoplasmata archaeon]